MKQLPFLILMAAGIAAVPTEAFAHQVQTNYVIDAQSRNTLEVQSVFSNGEPLKGANVTIYSPEQPHRPWAKGMTDARGRFTFTPDRSISGDWEIDIQREGHGDILVVPVDAAGIDADRVSQTEARDIHYAGSPWMAVGGVAIAAACLGFGRFAVKRKAE